MEYYNYNIVFQDFFTDKLAVTTFLEKRGIPKSITDIFEGNF